MQEKYFEPCNILYYEINVKIFEKLGRRIEFKKKKKYVQSYLVRYLQVRKFLRLNDNDNFNRNDNYNFNFAFCNIQIILFDSRKRELSDRYFF